MYHVILIGMVQDMNMKNVLCCDVGCVQFFEFVAIGFDKWFRAKLCAQVSSKQAS